MRIALTGVSGFLGAAIARKLAAADHQITGLIRPTSRIDHISDCVDRFVIGDQEDHSIWDDLLDEADCLIHNSFNWVPLKAQDIETHLQSNLTASIRLLQHAAPRKIIYISSVGVHHDMQPRWGGLVKEDHPLRPGNWYGACKAAVEDHLWSLHYSADVPFAILRPCAVYGIDPRLARSIGYPFIRKLRSQKSFERPGGGKFIHVEDVAAATLACVETESITKGVYNLADCYARWADIAAMFAETLGIDPKIDFSSPESPQNQFSKAEAHQLGIDLNRGHEGIHNYIRELVAQVDKTSSRTS